MGNTTENKYNRPHIGEIHTTNSGLTCKVIDGGSKPHYCTIQIENWTNEVRYNAVKGGRIKYPYQPNVYGVGYVGEGKYPKYVNNKNTKAYDLWNGMLQRCYSKEYQEKKPTYIGTTVCKEWHNFQVFAKWFHEESNYKEGWHLDKDLLSKDNKVYSPNTCVFIPPALNSFLTNVKLNNTSGYPGAHFNKYKNKWEASIHSNGKQKHLGTFKNKQIASLTYKLARKKEATKWKKEMMGILPQRVINNIK